MTGYDLMEFLKGYGPLEVHVHVGDSHLRIKGAKVSMGWPNGAFVTLEPQKSGEILAEEKT